MAPIKILYSKQMINIGYTDPQSFKEKKVLPFSYGTRHLLQTKKQELSSDSIARLDELKGGMQC